MPNFIDPNFDSSLDLARRAGPGLRLLRLGGFGRLGKAVGRFFDDERLQRIFTLPVDVRRARAVQALALYAVITYMDSVEGVYFPEGGMHAVPARMAGAGGRRRASSSATAHRSSASCLANGTSGPVRGVRLAGGEVIAADAVVCNPDLPVAYRTLLGGLERPAVARRGRYSPSCVVWHVGVRGDLPAEHRPPQHPLRHAVGRRRSSALLDDGTRMPDPSILVTVPSLDDPSLAPAGCAHALRARAGAEPRRHGSTGRRERRAMRDDLAERVATLRLPRRHRGRGVGRSDSTGSARAWSEARRSRSPTVPPDRAVPAGQHRPAGARASCSSAAARFPGSACRWCSCRGQAGRATGRQHAVAIGASRRPWLSHARR